MKTPLALTIFAALVFAAACSKTDPRTAPINAATPGDFEAWKTSAKQQIPKEEMDELDECVNEIRMGIMQRKEASGSGPVAQKVCDYVNGKNMREVMILGYQNTIDWVTKEIALKRASIAENAAKLKFPIAESSKDAIREHNKQVSENITRTLEPKLAVAQKRIAELQALINPPKSAPAK